MKILVSKLRPNPFRRVDAYPIDREKVEALKASIEETSFWDNLLARKADDGYEIAYGHHRLEALKELKIKEIDIPVRDIDDGMMIKIMANENRDTYKANRAVMIETIKVARDFLREQLNGEWEASDKSIRCLFPNKTSYSESKSKGVGRDTIKNFLGGNWKEWEIQEALSQMEETDKFDPASLEPFDKLAVASEAKTAMVAYHVPKARQKAIAEILVKRDISKANIRTEVATIARAEGYTREKAKQLPALPPMLEERLNEISKDIGLLHPRIHKVRGYLKHVRSIGLKIRLRTGAKILHDEIGEMLQELEKLDASEVETKSGSVQTDCEIINPTVVTN